MKYYKILVFLILIALINGCSTRGRGVYNNVSNVERIQYNPYPEEVQDYTQVLDPKMLKHPTMRPYTVHGKKYYPHLTRVGDEYRGTASWYGPNFHGKLTSNGETYNMHAMTAAHKTLPISTVVRVTNLRNGKSAVVRINDRGPFVDTRIIDLSNRAAKAIDMVGKGTAPVKLEVLGFSYKPKHRSKKRKSTKHKKPKNIYADYSLQISSFANIKGAIQTQEKYDGIDGYKSVIVDSMDNDGISTYKVVLKGFKSRNEVLDYKHRKFRNGFIIKDKKEQY